MEKLLEIMQELRQKCPWDQQQTPNSLTRYAIEEAYEVADAIERGEPRVLERSELAGAHVRQQRPDRGRARARRAHRRNPPRTRL